MFPRPVVSSEPRRARGSACELGLGLWRWAWLERVSRAPARTLGCLPPWICIRDVPAGCGAAPQPSPGVGSASPGSPKCRRRTLRCSPPCSYWRRLAREALMANKGFPGKRGCAGVLPYRDPPPQPSGRSGRPGDFGSDQPLHSLQGPPGPLPQAALGLESRARAQNGTRAPEHCHCHRLGASVSSPALLVRCQRAVNGARMLISARLALQLPVRSFGLQWTAAEKTAGSPQPPKPGLCAVSQLRVYPAGQEPRSQQGAMAPV